MPRYSPLTVPPWGSSFTGSPYLRGQPFGYFGAFLGGKIIVRLGVDDVMHGTITRCEPPRVLAYTWGTSQELEREDDRSILMFELEERQDRVLMVLTHCRLDIDEISEYGAGWHIHLGILTGSSTMNNPRSFGQPTAGCFSLIKR